MVLIPCQEDWGVDDGDNIRTIGSVLNWLAHGMQGLGEDWVRYSLGRWCDPFKKPSETGGGRMMLEI